MPTITLPKLYRKAIAPRPRTSIEHADLDCRALESLLAYAMTLEGHVLFVCKNTHRVKYLIRTWVPGAKIHSVGMSLFEHGDLSLWICGYERFPDQTPFSTLDYVISVESHQVLWDVPAACKPFLSSPKVPILCSGCLADRGTWFHRFSRGGKSERFEFDSDAIVAEFPDQAGRVLSTTHYNYDRGMALVDKDPKPLNRFSGFARDRLRVLTDKGPSFLSETQQAEARAQLGPRWASGTVGSPIVTFELGGIQRKYWARRTRAIRSGFNKILVLKYRRGGITTIEQADSYSMCVTAPGTTVSTIAHNSDTSRRIFGIAKGFQERDPRPARLVSDSKSVLEFENGSKFFVSTRVPRGDTVRKFHGSEIAFWMPGPNQIDDVSVMTAGIIGAASNGVTIYETTPNGEEWFCKTWREAKSDIANGIDPAWYPIFLAWHEDPSNVIADGEFNVDELRDTLTDEEKELLEKFDLTWNQVAFWRQKKAEHKRLVYQEYPVDDETCFLSSGIPYFNYERCIELRNYIRQQGKLYYRQPIPGGIFIKYEEPELGVEYFLGCDPSEGVPGCDPNGIGVMRRDTLAMVAEIHGLFSVRDLANWNCKLSAMYNDAIIAVERNNHGHAVLNAMDQMGVSKPYYEGGVMFYYTKKGYDPVATNRARDVVARAGFNTNTFTREIILHDLYEWIDAPGAEDRIRSAEFLDECLSFKKQASGKFEADPGARDDRVMKWAICLNMRSVIKRKPRVSVFEYGG